MFIPDDQPEPPSDEAVDRVLSGGARGEVAIAGLATLIVLAIWFVFYVFVFVPRATSP